jgi:alanine dehydrogenase
MIIGVPKEIKDHETRVGLVPSGVTALREAGHEVLVETHAGEGSSLTDEEYAEAGAWILDTAAEVWQLADLIVKVKEPQTAGIFLPPRPHPLHLSSPRAAARSLTNSSPPRSTA